MQAQNLYSWFEVPLDEADFGLRFSVGGFLSSIIISARERKFGCLLRGNGFTAPSLGDEALLARFLWRRIAQL